jgi:hypothetical protein
MPVAIYMDVHIPRAITLGLRREGVDVLTAQEDGFSLASDPELLSRATSLGRPLFTFDDDLLVEAERRQREGEIFGGVIYAHPLRISIAGCIKDLTLIAQAAETEDVLNHVLFLPF